MSTVKDGEIGVDSGEHKKKTAAVPSGNLLQFAIEHGPFSSLIYLLKMVIFHSFLYVYQRVTCNSWWFNPKNKALKTAQNKFEQQKLAGL